MKCASGQCRQQSSLLKMLNLLIRSNLFIQNAELMYSLYYYYYYYYVFFKSKTNLNQGYPTGRLQ